MWVDNLIDLICQSGFQRRGKTGSPWSTASDSPTPTNSVAERVHPVWEHSATGRGVWPANTGEEHAQLLGNCRTLSTILLPFNIKEDKYSIKI